jgi:hypothetical protein
MSTPRIRLNSECITAAKMAVDKGKKGAFLGALFYFGASKARLPFICIIGLISQNKRMNAKHHGASFGQTA